MRITMTAAALLFTAIPSAFGDETLAGRACRSVHLAYSAPEGSAFINEVKVGRSVPGTYFCVGGFNHGYLGIQELGNGKKVVIFAVWDPGKKDDPNSVEPNKRVKLLAKGEGVRIGRFGNEGTGGQSFLDLDWSPGKSYRFLLTSKVDGDRTAYSAHVAAPDAKVWKLIATFSTITGGKPLSGYYAFIEDFRRTKVSATQERDANFGPAWVRVANDGRWNPVSVAKFTADNNPSLAIDAGDREGMFFLATGGKTTNEHTPLGKRITLENMPENLSGTLPETYPPIP